MHIGTTGDIFSSIALCRAVLRGLLYIASEYCAVAAVVLVRIVGVGIASTHMGCKIGAV